jgi:hypothetical protein
VTENRSWLLAAAHWSRFGPDLNLEVTIAAVLHYERRVLARCTAGDAVTERSRFFGRGRAV